MAAKIRLTRVGAKKQPSYRVVIQEEASKRDGRFIENIGYYNPRSDPPTIVLNQERVQYWLSVGAQPTESVGHLLHQAGITDKYHRIREPRAKAPAAPAEQAATTVTAPAAAATQAEPS